jgi:hypothetical protein
MEFQLIDGRFSVSEAELLLTELVEAKLRHHARRIDRHMASEEDMKASEVRIKQLQNELRRVREYFRSLDADARIDIESLVTLNAVSVFKALS